MSDTNYSYLEASQRRKKRNRLISLVIVFSALLAGGIIWGWSELQKIRDAERIKNALNNQIVPSLQDTGDVHSGSEHGAAEAAEAQRLADEEKARLAAAKAEDSARIAAAEARAREEAAKAASKTTARPIEKQSPEAAARAEEQRRAREEAKAKANAEAEERKRIAAENKARQDAERQARAEEQRRAREEAAAKAKAQADEQRRLKDEATAKAKTEADEQRRLREEASAKAKAEADERARIASENKAKQDAERQARLETERKAKEESERQARVEAERKAREEAEKIAKASQALKAEPKVDVTNKVFEPEDLPAPQKPVLSEEAREALAMAASPAKKSEQAAKTGVETESFRIGMQAYTSGEMVQAVQHLAKVPAPPTKQKGNPQRDEYVLANFYRGVALQRSGNLSEAISAYNRVLEYERYYPVTNMNLGICYVELKQYAKAHRAFERVIRDQSFIEPEQFDDVMQRTRYFWALTWTRMYRSADNEDRRRYYREQALTKWKDYQVWFASNEKYRKDNQRAENYIKSINAL